MIAHVFKRLGARMYSGRYRLDREKKITQVELGCSNRQVAEKKFGKIVEEKEREVAGIIAPKDQREAARTPLVEHLDEMIASKAPENDRHYLGNMKGRITRLVAECGWKYAKDVSPESYQTWVMKQGLSAKALNEYLTSARTLFNWMEKRGRIPVNPLKSVDLLSTAGESRNPRRALTDGELAKLVDGSGEASIAYLVTATTGLRYAKFCASRGATFGWMSHSRESSLAPRQRKRTRRKLPSRCIRWSQNGFWPSWSRSSCSLRIKCSLRSFGHGGSSSVIWSRREFLGMMPSGAWLISTLCAIPSAPISSGSALRSAC
jgi:hypothetical protein